MNGEMFTGLGVAMVTPMLQNGEIDFNGLSKLTEHLIAGKTDYLVVMGTTGESVTLSASEKLEVLKKVKEINAGRCKIVFGCGGNNTSKLVEEFKGLKALGIDGILSASPSYNKPTQEGIYQHYKALATATELPIILYNVPGRTSSNMTAATTVRLAKDFKNIVAIKEASGNLEQVIEIMEQKPEGFEVISGDDPLVLPVLSVGGIGVISVIGNAYPGIYSQMIRDFQAGKIAEARKAFLKVSSLIPLLFKEGNPGGIKESLKHMGICNHFMRLPLVPVSAELSTQIKKKVDSI
ncbi:MAG: 4-hydroxy-tetrahydrodipicolinate synthase [Luteibaculum sp.]